MSSDHTTDIEYLLHYQASLLSKLIIATCAINILQGQSNMSPPGNPSPPSPPVVIDLTTQDTIDLSEDSDDGFFILWNKK